MCRMSESNNAAFLGPLETLRSGAIPGQANYDRAIATHAPGIAPTTVKDAAFGRVSKIEPVGTPLPHCRIRVPIRARPSRHNRLAVCRDSDR